MYEGEYDENKAYEQYGVSPSPDYPSEIETVNGSVEVDVVNKNLLNTAKTEETTKGGITYSVKNGILKLNGTATAGFDIQLSKNIKIKKGKYIHSSNYIQSGLYISFDNLGYTVISATVGKKRKIEITEDTIYKRYFIWIDKGTVLNNVEIELQLEVGDTATDFVEHQSQTAIMPIQQEMLENDYVADVEHHEWQKFIFDGVTNRLNQKTGTSANNLYYTSYISNLLAPTSNGVKIEICSNCFKSYTANQLYGQDLVGVAVTTGKSFSIGFGLESSIDTLDKANEKLKELYDAGTPIIIYYKLAEAIDLELTSEQKAVRNQKLYTYKNISNIDVSDELASIDVEYKKNPATEHDDLQNQIDEIKQLISTTETSALLLDNLQKDVESEVE